MANNGLIPHSLDDYFQSMPIGSIEKAIGNNLYGINHTQVPSAVPSNKETYGLTFFTRPQLNMQKDNLRNARIFYPLLTDHPLTIQMFVKCMLDPRLMNGYKFYNNKSFGAVGNSIPAIQTPLVDNQMAFIPILTNNLNSISGWPDVLAPTFTSKSGLFNESYSLVDGVVRNYESFDLDATFRNVKGDPIIYMFYIWLHYMSYVFEGRLIPYIDFITENELDYNTRIYRLVLDKNKETVTKIAATGASFPYTVPMGSFFDFTTDKPYNDQNKDITIRFKCNGVDYQDDILIKEFNKTVTIFNPSMRDENRDRYMIKIDKQISGMFNHRGYPRINTDNYKLEWWISKEIYSTRTSLFINSNLKLSNIDDSDEYVGD